MTFDCAFVVVLCCLLLWMSWALTPSFETFQQSCKAPDGATLFDDGDGATNPFLDAYYGEQQCRLTDTSVDDGAPASGFVESRSVPLPSDDFGFMDSQWLSCSNANGSMSGWGVTLDEDNTLSSRGLCRTDLNRPGFAATRYTPYSPKQAGMLPHHLDCGDSPLVSIGFQSLKNGNVRAVYECASDVVTDDEKRRTYYTGWNAAGNVKGGETIRSTLHSQTVQCPEDTVLTSVRASSCSIDDTRTLVYTCDPVDQNATSRKVARLGDRAASRGSSVDPSKIYRVTDLIDKEPPTVFDKLSGALRPMTNAAQSVRDHVQGAATTTERVFDSAKRTLGKVGDKADATMTRGGDVVGGDIGKAIREVGKGFRAVGTGVEKVRDVAADSGHAVVKFAGKDVLRPTVGAIRSVGDGISGAFKSIGDKFPGDALKAKLEAEGADIANKTTCQVAVPVKKTGQALMSGFRSMKKGFDAVKKGLGKIGINI